MRSDDLYLADIIAAAEAVARFLKGVTRDRFLSDELIQSAVLQKLIVIGEAASRLSPDFRAKHSGIEWSDITAFRNIAVHAYFNVDWSIVWVATTKDTPLLRRRIVRIRKGRKR